MAGPRARRRWGALVVGVMLGACGRDARPALEDHSTRDDLGRIIAPGDVGVLRLRPGDCFIAGDDEVETVRAVPCAADHDSEVFAVFDMEDTAWPGATAVEEGAREGCLVRFEGATGLAFDPTVASLTAYAPTHGSWADDRSVICVALTPDGSLVRGGLTGPTA